MLIFFLKLDEAPCWDPTAVQSTVFVQGSQYFACTFLAEIREYFGKLPADPGLVAENVQGLQLVVLEGRVVPAPQYLWYYTTNTIEEESQRRKGKGRRDGIECHTSHLAPGWFEEKDK